VQNMAVVDFLINEHSIFIDIDNQVVIKCYISYSYRIWKAL